MQIQSLIEELVQSGLAPAYSEVINESHMHSVPADSETHFKLVIVSEQFAGVGRVARHQQVYRLLAEPLAGPVHALALHTYTPEEWERRRQAAPDSPDCRGGSRTSD